MTSHDAGADDERSLREAFGFDLDDESWFKKVKTTQADAPLGWLGPYELLAELGRGGQGVVYKARQPKTQRVIALKLTGPVAGSSATFRIRFEREMRTAAALKHPNIVTVFGGDVIDGRPVLLMEFVDGAPIDRWAATDGSQRPDLRRIAALFERLCATVAHAHQRGVIHRDLKPSNVLVDAAAEPRVLDFGLARLLSPFATESLFATHTTAFVGTPAYASPEHFADDDSAVDVRSDVYAVGVMLYQAMTGQLPYSSKLSFNALMKAIQGRDPPRPSSIAPLLGRELEAIIVKAMAKDKRERYQTMDAVAEDLRRYLAGDTVLAHPPGAIYQMRKMIRRHRLAFAIIAGFIVLIVAFAVTAATLAVRERAARQDADWNSYTASIAAASAALRADDAAAAQTHLRRAPQHLRNWEWHHFSNQADGSVHTAAVSGQACAVDRAGEPILTVQIGADLEHHGRADRTCAAILEPSPASIFEISPGLRYALMGESDLQLVEVETNRVIARWPSKGFYGALFSPDEALLAMGSWSGTVCILRIPGAEKTPASGPVAPEMEARSLTESDFEHVNVGTKIHRLAFSPDSRLMAISTGAGEIKIFDLPSRQTLQTLPVERAAYGLAFSPDGAVLAVGSWANRITLWDWAAGKAQWSSEGHRELISDLAFSPDGSLLASASWDKSIRVWSAASGALLARFVGHETEVESLAFLGDNDRIISRDRNGILKTWSLSSRRPPTASGEFQRIEHLACSVGSAYPGWLGVREGPDDSWQDTRVTWVDLGRRQKAASFALPWRVNTFLLPLGASADGRWLAAAGADGTILLWHVEDVAGLSNTQSIGRVPAPDPAKRLLPSAPCPDLYPSSQNFAVYSPALACMVLSLSFGPDNRGLAVARFDGTVEMWDVQRGEILWQRPMDVEPHPRLCACCPNGKRLALADGAGTLQMLRAEDGHVLLEAQVSSEPSNCYLAVSPDGALVAPSLHGNDIVLYRTGDLSVAARLRGHARRVNNVAFSPDGTRLASAGEDGLKLWDVASGREVATLYGHAFNVTCVVFTPDGRTLISGGHDNTVRFWDAEGR